MKAMTQNITIGMKSAHHGTSKCLSNQFTVHELIVRGSNRIIGINQLNGGSKWIPGAIVCSDKPIETLNVRVWDSNGIVHEYTYTETN